MAKSDPMAYWPLVRMIDDEWEDDPNNRLLYLTDADMILLRASLRVSCRAMSGGDRLDTAMEILRHKIERILDLEFSEGQFEGEPIPAETDDDD